MESDAVTLQRELAAFDRYVSAGDLERMMIWFADDAVILGANIYDGGRRR